MYSSQAPGRKPARNNFHFYFIGKHSGINLSGYYLSVINKNKNKISVSGAFIKTCSKLQSKRLRGKEIFTGFSLAIEHK
jgi:hypothetical protein